MKGGNLRLVARRMRELAEDLEEKKVDVRKEDKAIRPFKIPVQENLSGEIITFSSVSVLDKNKPKKINIDIKLRKNKHLLLSGPNGIGKSTLLEHLAHGTEKGAMISDGVRVGYYRR